MDQCRKETRYTITASRAHETVERAHRLSLLLSGVVTDIMGCVPTCSQKDDIRANPGCFLEDINYALDNINAEFSAMESEIERLRG